LNEIRELLAGNRVSSVFDEEETTGSKTDRIHKFC